MPDGQCRLLIPNAQIADERGKMEKKEEPRKNQGMGTRKPMPKRIQKGCDKAETPKGISMPMPMPLPLPMPMPMPLPISCRSKPIPRCQCC